MKIVYSNDYYLVTQEFPRGTCKVFADLRKFNVNRYAPEKMEPIAVIEPNESDATFVMQDYTLQRARQIADNMMKRDKQVPSGSFDGTRENRNTL